jgi:ferredoxin
MGKFKVEHDRPSCIGCGACTAMCDMWTLDDNDGKSNLKGAKRLPDGKEELEFDEKDLDKHKEAAEACPVNVIHIKNKKTDEQVI